MLHYETVMRLTKAKEETNLIGVLVFLSNGDFGYGYIHIEEENYESNKYSDPFTYDIISSKNFQDIIEYLNSKEKVNEEEFGSLSVAIAETVEYFMPMESANGEFSDLQNIKEIINYGYEKKLNYILFKEDNVWNSQQ